MRFSSTEGQRRQDVLRETAGSSGYLGYIVFSSENFIYMTNFLLDVAPWERPVAAIFPVDGEPSLIMNELSTHHYRLAVERGTCWVKDAVLYDEHPRLTKRTYLRPDWDRMFVDVLRRHGLTSGLVAVDTLGPISPAIRAALPDVTFHAEPGFLHHMREVKSSEELELLRCCAKLTNWAQLQYPGLVEPREYVMDVDLELAKRLGRRAVEEYPDEAVEVRVKSSAGAMATSCPHWPGSHSGKRFEVGDGILNVVVCRINGYGVENERTLFVGEPSAAQKEYFELMRQAQAAATAQMVEGNLIADIDSAGLRVYENAGAGDYVLHRTGHGIGIGGHEYPDDMAFNYRPLQAGMVFSSEPALFVPGVGGFRHSDTVVVGKDEPEILTQYTRSLEDLIIPV